jgi:hypothetical protein
MNHDESTEDGPPLAELTELEQEVSPSFLGAIRRKIYRRTAISQVAVFSWNVPRVVFLEVLSFVTYLLSNLGGKRRSEE